jgi:hypothetical protein
MASEMWFTLEFDHCEASWFLKLEKRLVESLTVFV